MRLSEGGGGRQLQSGVQMVVVLGRDHNGVKCATMRLAPSPFSHPLCIQYLSRSEGWMRQRVTEDRARRFRGEHRGAQSATGHGRWNTVHRHHMRV